MCAYFKGPMSVLVDSLDVTYEPHPRFLSAGSHTERWWRCSQYECYTWSKISSVGPHTKHRWRFSECFRGSPRDSGVAWGEKGVVPEIVVCLSLFLELHDFHSSCRSILLWYQMDSERKSWGKMIAATQKIEKFPKSTKQQTIRAHDCEDLGFCLPAPWNPLAERSAGRNVGRQIKCAHAHIVCPRFCLLHLIFSPWPRHFVFKIFKHGQNLS